EQAADRTAKRNDDVERGQVSRVRLQTGELSVADHAADKEGEPGQGDRFWGGDAFVVRPDTVSHEAQGSNQQWDKDRALVKAGGLKAEDEAEQVDSGGYDPQERDRGDVLRQVGGDSE